MADNKYKYLNVNLGDNSVNEDVPTRITFENSINDLDTKISEVQSDNFSIGDLKQSVRDYDKKSGWLPCDGSSINLGDYPLLYNQLSGTITYNYNYYNINPNQKDDKEEGYIFKHKKYNGSSSSYNNTNNGTIAPSARIIVDDNETIIFPFSINVSSMRLGYNYKKKNSDSWTQVSIERSELNSVLKTNLLPTGSITGSIFSSNKLFYNNGKYLLLYASNYNNSSRSKVNSTGFSILYYSNSIENLKNSYIVLHNDKNSDGELMDNENIMDYFKDCSFTYEDDNNIQYTVLLDRFFPINVLYHNNELIFFGWLGSTDGKHKAPQLYLTSGFCKVSFDQLTLGVKQKTGDVFVLNQDATSYGSEYYGKHKELSVYPDANVFSNGIIKYKNYYFTLTAWLRYNGDDGDSKIQYNIIYFNEKDTTQQAYSITQKIPNSDLSNKLLSFMPKAQGEYRKFFAKLSVDDLRIICVFNDSVYFSTDTENNFQNWNHYDIQNLNDEFIYDIIYSKQIYFIQTSNCIYTVNNFEDIQNKNKWSIYVNYNQYKESNGNDANALSNLSIDSNFNMYFGNYENVIYDYIGTWGNYGSSGDKLGIYNITTATNVANNMCTILYNNMQKNLPNIPDTSDGVKTYIKAK